MSKHVTALGGVFLKAENPVELARWYGEMLGLPLDPGEQPATAQFEWRDKDNADTVGTTVWALFPKETDYLGDGPAMLNYRVDDLDGLLAELETAGVWVDPNRGDYEYGKFGWIKDPEGNRIELWQPIEEVAEAN